MSPTSKQNSAQKKGKHGKRHSETRKSSKAKVVSLSREDRVVKTPKTGKSERRSRSKRIRRGDRKTPKSSKKHRSKGEYGVAQADNFESEPNYAFRKPNPMDNFDPSPVPKEKGDGEEIPPALAGIMSTSMKDEVWRRIQFCGNDANRDEMVKMWLTKSGLRCFYIEEGKLNPHFVQVYTKFGQDEHNRQRSDTVNKIKKVCDECYHNHGKKLPTIAALQKIVYREKDANPDLFVWWWDTLLPKIPGSHYTWGKNQYNYHTISAYKDEKGTPHVTPGLEAFALLTIENNHAKWTILLNYKEKHPKTRIYIVPEIISDKHKDIDGKKRYLSSKKLPKLKTKYTETGAGQVKFGGYTQEGLKRWLEIKKNNKEGRKKSGDLEAEILRLVREKHEISAETNQPPARREAVRAVEDELAKKLGWMSDEAE